MNFGKFPGIFRPGNFRTQNPKLELPYCGCG